LRLSTVSFAGEYGISSTETKGYRKSVICRSFVCNTSAVGSENCQEERAFVRRYGMFLRESTVYGGGRFAALFLSEDTVNTSIRGPLRRVGFAGYSLSSVAKRAASQRATGGLAFLLEGTVFAGPVSVLLCRRPDVGYFVSGRRRLNGAHSTLYCRGKIPYPKGAS
jgi:hypothetical protein